MRAAIAVWCLAFGVMGCASASERLETGEAGVYERDADGRERIDAGDDAPDTGRDGDDAGRDGLPDAGIELWMDAGIELWMDAGIELGMDAGIELGMDAGGDASVSAAPCIPLPGIDAPYHEITALRVTDPTWTRPGVAMRGMACPTSGVVSRYHVRTFCAPTVPVDFVVWVNTAAPLSLGDSMLFAYEGTGVPADPSACVASNDDFAGVDPELTVVALPGNPITVVLTGFAPEAMGTYEIRATTRPR